MAGEVRDTYLLALHDLSKTDPGKWQSFLIAFNDLVYHEYEKALSAPTNDALISVGSGRRMRDLREDFIHIDTIVAKLKR